MLVAVGNHLYVFVKNSQQFFFCDATKGSISRLHRDIAQIVQGGEDAQLAEFGDACDEDKLLVLVANFDCLVKLLHNMAHFFKLVGFVQVIQQRRIVFVQDDNGFQAGLLVGAFDKPSEAFPRGGFRLVSSIKAFIIFQFPFQSPDNLLKVGLVFAGTQIEMQHRMLVPVFFQFRNGEAFEKVFPTLEIVF